MKIVVVILWVLAALALHLFGNHLGTFVVLIVSVVVPLFCGILVLMARAWLRVTMEAAPAENFRRIEDSDTQSPVSSLAISAGRIHFLFKITCTLSCKNSFTGQTDTTIFSLSKKQNPFTIKSIHCGALHITANNFKISDHLGLFSRQLSLGLFQQKIILPTAYPFDILITNTATSPESDEYSTTKAGMDVSETFAIREYQPGDPIRSVHWKLSEKLDKPMVREFGLPIANSVLLVFAGTSEEISADGWHASAEMFYSAAVALIESSANAILAWQTKNGLCKYELRNIKDAEAAMREFFITVVKDDYQLPNNDFEQIVAIIPGNTPQILFS